MSCCLSVSPGLLTALSSAKDLAFQKVYQNKTHTEIDFQLGSIFQLKSLPDDLEFTSLHCIVLGLLDRDLESELQLYQDLVNVEDTLGRTALWWSSRRDEVQTSALLLRYGANPNIFNHAGRSPLHNCASRGDYSLTKMMLQAGADVHQRSFEGKMPIHVFGAHGDHPALVGLLLEYGSGVNSQDHQGRTTLSLCCFNDTSLIVEVLYENGADHNICDDRDWLPWHWAI